MANKYATLDSLFTAIANSIRAKTGGAETIVADDFPSAIDAIEAGGGAATVAVFTATPSSNATSISFTGLPAEPKMFALMKQAQLTNGTTRTITSVMCDGTTCHSMTAYQSSTRTSGYTYYYSDCTFAYSNGTLTITSPSTSTVGYFTNTEYMLICAY